MQSIKKIVFSGKKKRNLSIAIIVFVVTLYSLLIAIIFNSFTKQYSNDVTRDSAIHLMDISNQVGKLVDEGNDSAWRATNSIMHSIVSQALEDTDEIHAFVEEEKEIWGISDVFVITEDGKCYNNSGTIIANDAASDMAVEAQRNGKLMQINKSFITYTLPTPNTSDFNYNGSRVVAVSAVRDLSKLIDDMNVESFGGEAYLYLTENRGALISQLTNKNAAITTNAYSLFENDEMECLTDEGERQFTPEDTTDSACVFLNKSAEEPFYIVVTPVDIGEEESMKLFYIVSESAVNKTTSTFTSRTIRASVYTVVAFFVMIMLIFLVLYLMRGKKLALELAAREKMFDLLVANTKNVYGLLQLNDNHPTYITKNSSAILGDDFYTLHRENGVYKLESNTSDGASNAILQLNDELKDWNGRNAFSSEYIPYVTNGEKGYFVFRLYPTSSADDFIAIIQDITKEHEREEALRNTLVLADSANIAKTQFLSNMSHDIRTPMNAIVNMASFALEAIDDREKLLEYLGVIKDSSEHLLHLINDILDMSRIESGKMIIEEEPFDIEDTLDEVSEIIRVLANQRKQKFVVNQDVKSPKLIGDRVKVSQILLNLLNNAVKYTDVGGEITFTATEIHSLKSELGVFRFVISDNGVGIEKEKLEKIFEPFVRSETTQSVVEGTGLGLSICKNYVDAMGGFLSVTSIVGKGSTFIAELHFNKDFTNAEVVERTIDKKPESFEGKRALLVEDNVINQKVAMMVLGKLGFNVDTANNGKEGYVAFINSNPGYYDLIYMDVQMPVMNGYEATAAIRESTHSQAKTIPIIAMTANVFAEDIEKSRVSGMDGHVGKPIVIDELITITEKVFEEKRKK